MKSLKWISILSPKKRSITYVGFKNCIIDLPQTMEVVNKKGKLWKTAVFWQLVFSNYWVVKNKRERVSFQIFHLAIYSKNLLGRLSLVDIYELKTRSKQYHTFVTWIRTFLGPYKLGSPHFWSIKLYTAIDNVKQYLWCNGIAMRCFKSVLWCVKILTEK